MTNYQCYSYGVKALSNIINNGLELTPDTFWSELYYLWDVYSEDAIEKIVKKAEFYNDLF